MSQFLEYEEVEHHVRSLPRPAREQLALGPIPHDGTDDDPAGCRVCHVLAPGTGTINAPPGHHPRALQHAHELYVWHDASTRYSWPSFVEYTAERITGLDPDWRAKTGLGTALTGPGLLIVEHVMGALSYARCCLIYALASASLTTPPPLT